MKKGDYLTSIQANEYHQNRFSGGLAVVNKDEQNIVSQFLKDIVVNSSKVLDIGSGTGRILKSILPLNPKYIIASDISKAMLEKLKSNYQKGAHYKKIITINAPSDRLTLKNNSVDIVTSFHLVKHLEDIKPTIKEISRVLKPNGYLLFDFLNKNSIVVLNSKNCYSLSLSELTKTLSLNKLKIVKIYNLHFFGETIYRYTYPYLSRVIHFIDNLLSKSRLLLGTKILVIAKKE